MIDTIVIRIHNYEKYKHYEKYVTQQNPDSYAKKFRHGSNDILDKTSILYGDTGRILGMSLRTTMHIPSSHYDIVVYPCKERDFIEFNLSIPKYLYSHNVMQFIDTYDTSVKHTFSKLLNFISKFFMEYLPTMPEWLDVEINRIDLCFNQFFLSKADAMRYLSEQAKLNIQYARSDKNKFSQYGDTTVQYKTDNYSFKIYHKGTEFRKNDMNKLVKNNPKKFNILELAETADKVLRYELTARKGLMNYLLKQHLINDDNTMINQNLQFLSKHRNHAINNTLRNLKGKAIAIASSKEQIEVFINKNIQNKTMTFFLHSEWEQDQTTAKPLLENYNMPFNFELFDCLHQFFWERVKKYQLGVKMGMVDIQQKIKEHQEKKKIKNKIDMSNKDIEQGSSLLLLATLSQFIDISELKNVVPRSTYYRYTKKLEELGVPRHSPDIAVNPPPLDYQTYIYYFSKYHLTFN